MVSRAERYNSKLHCLGSELCESIEAILGHWTQLAFHTILSFNMLPTRRCAFKSPALLARATLALCLLGCQAGESHPGVELSSTPASSDNTAVQGRGEGKDQWWDALPRAAWSEFRRVEQSQPWFEVYEIRPGVLALYEPGQFEEVISYLIIGSKRALLFDTGLGIGDMRRLVGELTEREVVVLNSHTHYDHVGGNHAFDKIYGTGLDYTRRNARGRPHEAVAEFVGEGWIWKATPAGFSPEAYVSRPFTVTEPVADGQVISLGDVALEVLLTPGHAPDALCLLDRQRRLLFTGDTFYPATLYAHLPGSTFADYQRTAARLAGLADAVDLVLPAHNEPTLPPSELLVLKEAFLTLPQDDMPFVLTDGHREYDFGRFSILVSEPPPWPPQ